MYVQAAHDDEELHRIPLLQNKFIVKNTFHSARGQYETILKQKVFYSLNEVQ